MWARQREAKAHIWPSGTRKSQTSDRVAGEPKDRACVGPLEEKSCMSVGRSLSVFFGGKKQKKHQTTDGREGESTFEDKPPHGSNTRDANQL